MSAAADEAERGFGQRRSRGDRRRSRTLCSTRIRPSRGRRARRVVALPDLGRTDAPGDAALSRAPNVLMTPHVSGWTEGMLDARAAVIAENIERTARGETPLNLVDPRH